MPSKKQAFFIFVSIMKYWSSLTYFKNKCHKLNLVSIYILFTAVKAELKLVAELLILNDSLVEENKLAYKASNI